MTTYFETMWLVYTLFEESQIKDVELRRAEAWSLLCMWKDIFDIDTFLADKVNPLKYSILVKLRGLPMLGYHMTMAC